MPDIKQLVEAYAQLDPEEWDFAILDNAEIPASVVIDSDGEEVLRHAYGVTTKAQEEVAFIAEARNAMPALLDLYKAVAAQITEKGELRISNPSEILRAMDRLESTGNTNDANQRLAKAPIGIDDAISEAMKDASLSIYGAHVDSYTWNGLESKLYHSVNAVVASNSGLLGAKKAAIDVGNKAFTALRSKSVITDDAVLILRDTDAHDIYPILHNNEIKMIRLAIDMDDGNTIAKNLTQITGLECTFHGNSVWWVQGDACDQNDMAVKTIKELCTKSPNELSEAMSFFGDSDADEHRLR